MWEGQSTSRFMQIIASMALAILSLLFALIGAVGIWMCFVKEGSSVTTAVVVTISLLVGLLGLVVAYRLFFGRGVCQGGGLMSPLAYKLGGFFFLALAADFTYDSVIKHDVEGVKAVVGSLLIAMFFFVAARHRSAMRRID